MSESQAALERKLDYAFENHALYEQALKHRSYAKDHNERLEFLGDAILGSVIACYLFEHFKESCEGGLSRLRAQLVKKDSLADLAQDLDLGSFVLLGEGELKSGGFRRASILADGLEALFGAIYLDGGFVEAKRVILALYRDKLANLTPESAEKDPKTLLQEWLQAHAKPLPQYDVVKIVGAQHDQQFSVQCQVESYDFIAEGSGASRRRAEQQAASRWLQWLDAEGKDAS